MRGCVDEALYAFLVEWYGEADYVEGHTSGSTGLPKPVRLLKSDMKASAQLTNSVLGIDSSSTLLLCLSPAYIAGKMIIVRALQAGARLEVVAPSSLPLDDVRQPISLAAMVPMQVAETLRRKGGQEQLMQIEKLLIGGAPLDQSLEQKLANIPIEVYVTYGMTETVSHIALRRIGENSGCYKALGDVTFTTDSRDCLVIDAPQLSGRRFVTNDVVQLIDARTFVWRGRYDNIIMSGGLKFCAEVLEGKIASLFNSRYYITSAPDERLGQRIVLVIESTPYTQDKEVLLRASLSQKLTPYEMPREIRYIPRFEETLSGKVRRI